MGLFYFLTMYCFIRGAEDGTAVRKKSYLWLGYPGQPAHWDGYEGGDGHRAIDRFSL